MIRILHLTPHLGGGVGSALSTLVALAQTSQAEHEHVIVCLEEPEKTQFVDKARNSGCRVEIAPSPAKLRAEIEDSDIVQLEFWNHPATLQMLCTYELPEMRLLVWCHVSGLHYPSIPQRLLTLAHKFVFTSECSMEAPEVTSVDIALSKEFGVVSGGGGLDQLPEPDFVHKAELPFSAGYLGSLNFAKLHPDFVSYLAAVRIPEFNLKIFGDETNRAVLERQALERNRPNLFDFRGYTSDVPTELSGIDMMPYLLNPHHYGTGEIALLEAMAMGVVPIVLDNPAETSIVQDGKTGLVVRSIEEFANAVEWLSTHTNERLEMARAASADIRKKYTFQNMGTSMTKHYASVLKKPKTVVAFTEVFGDKPSDWFRAFHRDNSMFQDDGTVNLKTGQTYHALFERTKGSAFHFLDYFPKDATLQKWVGTLEFYYMGSAIMDLDHSPKTEQA
jgi:L-malate glycosyltransferase